MPRQKIAGKKGKVGSKASSQASASSKSKATGKKKTAPAEGGVKEKRTVRWRPGTVALREIKRY